MQLMVYLLSKSLVVQRHLTTTVGFYCLDGDCGPRTFCHKMYDILQFEIMAIKPPFNIELRYLNTIQRKFQFEFFSDIHLTFLAKKNCKLTAN